FMDTVLGLSAAACALYSGQYFRITGGTRGEYYALLSLSTFGAMILVHAVNLLTVFVGLETMSLGAYALVGFRRSSLRGIEGAIKYFLLGSFGSALFLFGAAMLYGASGTTQLAAIRASIAAGQ